MTKKDIKAVFKSEKVQLNPDAINLIEAHLKKEVTKMAIRCKQGNFKRLTPDCFWVAIGDWGLESGSRKLSK